MRTWDNKVMSTSFAFILAVLALVPATVWSYEGRVVDKDTGKPIEGAYVVAAWRGSLISPPERVSVCFHVEVVMTDKEGKFSFSDWSGNINPLIVNRRIEPEVFYKAGYYWDLSKPFPIINKTYVLTPHSGTPEQRFEQIKVPIPLECGLKDSAKKLAPLIRTIYAEAKEAAVTDKQKESAEGWLYTADIFEFDISVADKNKQLRQIEREKGSLSKPKVPIKGSQGEANEGITK